MDNCKVKNTPKEKGRNILAKDVKVGQYLWLDGDIGCMPQFAEVSAVMHVGVTVKIDTVCPDWRSHIAGDATITVMDLNIRDCISDEVVSHLPPQTPVWGGDYAQFNLIMTMVERLAGDVAALEEPFSNLATDFNELAGRMNRVISKTKCFSAPPERVEEFRKML